MLNVYLYKAQGINLYIFEVYGPPDLYVRPTFLWFNPLIFHAPQCIRNGPNFTVMKVKHNQTGEIYEPRHFTEGSMWYRHCQKTSFSERYTYHVPMILSGKFHVLTQTRWQSWVMSWPVDSGKSGGLRWVLNYGTKLNFVTHPLDGHWLLPDVYTYSSK